MVQEPPSTPLSLRPVITIPEKDEKHDDNGQHDADEDGRDDGLGSWVWNTRDHMYIMARLRVLKKFSLLQENSGTNQPVISLPQIPCFPRKKKKKSNPNKQKAPAWENYTSSTRHGTSLTPHLELDSVSKPRSKIDGRGC